MIHGKIVLSQNKIALSQNKIILSQKQFLWKGLLCYTVDGINAALDVWTHAKRHGDVYCVYAGNDFIARGVYAEEMG